MAIGYNEIMGPGFFIFFQTVRPSGGFSEPPIFKPDTRIIQDDEEILDFLIEFVTDKL